MKKFLFKILVFFLILFAIFAPVNILIDPYNIFHYDDPVNNGVEPNKNFIKTKYIIHNQDKFDSLVFGSSRAGFIDVEKIPGGTYYDMASSEAVPQEHVNTLKVLIKNGFVPKNILLLVDDISCFVDPAVHENTLYRVPYPTGGFISQLEFYSKYCDLLTTYQSLSVIREHEDNDPDFAERFRRTGTERLDIVSEFTGKYEDGTEVPGYWADYYSLRLTEATAQIQEFVDICEQYDINLTIVTNPLYCKTYERDLENGYLEFLDALADVTDYYNFSSFSNVTEGTGNYYEASHFIPAIGRMMIDAAYNGEVDPVLLKQGFGVKVTAENKEEFIEFLREQAVENGVGL
ncbi:MAG TPA: hypothetical protein PLU43_06785 [Lachnospiraceae bacterium]|nr:hypothetical protein [Lachnospiraceae bacterium]